MSREEQIRGFFGFGERDLLVNRQGQFSDKQKKNLADVDQWASRFIATCRIQR